MMCPPPVCVRPRLQWSPVSFPSCRWLLEVSMGTEVWLTGRYRPGAPDEQHLAWKQVQPAWALPWARIAGSEPHPKEGQLLPLLCPPLLTTRDQNIWGSSPACVRETHLKSGPDTPPWSAPTLSCWLQAGFGETLRQVHRTFVPSSPGGRTAAGEARPPSEGVFALSSQTFSTSDLQIENH